MPCISLCQRVMARGRSNKKLTTTEWVPAERVGAKVWFSAVPLDGPEGLYDLVHFKVPSDFTTPAHVLATLRR